jgi:hypothetical protein
LKPQGQAGSHHLGSFSAGSGLPNLLLFDGFDVLPDSGRYAPQLEVSGYDAGRDDAPEHNQ